MIEFPYQKERSKLFGEILRPAAEFEIETGAGWILPRSFIRVLNIKVEKEKVEEIRGIGEGVVPIIVKKCRIKLGDEIFEARIAIALIEEVPYILGRTDIFDRYKVCFDQKKGIIRFE